MFSFFKLLASNIDYHTNKCVVRPLQDIKGRGPLVVVWGSFLGLVGLKETQMFLPHPLVKLSIVGNLRDRNVACSDSHLQGLNLESCVWTAVSSHSYHHPQEFILARFSLYVHKSGLKPDSFHFIIRH